ncbi:MAG: DNA translocase FtsK [Fibrobacteria bacterium]|nr:DNA translocase FtsK [Fibrobacteria bacterium]
MAPVKTPKRKKSVSKPAPKTVRKVATKKATSTKKTAKKAKKSDEDLIVSDLDDFSPALEGHHSREMFGLFLIAVAAVVTISLVSHFVQGSQKNILGDYLGIWLAQGLNLLTGSFPAVLLIATVIILGLKIIQQKTDFFDFKMPLVAGALYLLTSVMLSIKNIGFKTLDFSRFEETGGFIGNFIVQQTLVPVFGRAAFGPYLVTSILIFFVIIWGFKLRIAQVIEKTIELGGIFVFPVFDALDNLRLRRSKKRVAIAQKWILNSVEETSDREASSVDLPLVSDSGIENIVPVQKQQKTKKSEEPEMEVNESDFRDLVQDLCEMKEEDITDPMEIRKRRDRLKELKRIAELNEWEVQQRDPAIGGIVKKENDGSSQAKSKKTKKKKEPSAFDNHIEEPVLEKVIEQDEVIPDVEVEEIEPAQIIDLDQSHTVAQLVPTETKAAPGQEPELKKEEKAPAREIKYDDYVVPELNAVLEEPPIQPVQYTESFLKEQARILEEQLANFKVMGKVVGICTGPVITRYEVELAPGVKVNRISGLSDDLAMALRAKSIRILAPIPGKSAVGIEVPNKKAQIVYIKDILKTSSFFAEPDTIKLVLGKDIAGDPCVMDLAKAPHLLIAGQTGSGKSVGINSFMASILCSKTPEEVRMILVDPKVVELKPYDAIPHLLAPVVNEPEIAVQALKWATVEMDKRYNLLAKAGVRNIKGFNQKFRGGTLLERVGEADNKLLPFIVIIIDELADLMMVAGKEVETSIARIAQKARAVGIHLILATQRPSTNVITGTIKANLPTRVAFQVASQIDARTIMDKAGCEKLLGRGDMLFRSIDSPEPERIHGSFVTDDEAESLARACASQFVNYPHIPTFDLESDSMQGEEQDIPRDVKFRDAAEMLVALRQASVSLLQRRMSIGYARAGRIMDQLERAGIVGRDRGSKPREVLMDELELASFLSSGLNG